MLDQVFILHKMNVITSTMKENPLNYNYYKFQKFKNKLKKKKFLQKETFKRIFQFYY